MEFHEFIILNTQVIYIQDALFLQTKRFVSVTGPQELWDLGTLATQTQVFSFLLDTSTKPAALLLTAYYEII